MYNPKTQNHRYGKNIVPNNGNSTQNHENSDNNFYNEGIVQFRLNDDHQESDNSGVNSPPLWKNYNSPSPPKSPSYPLLSHHHHNRSLSPNSRTQAIARGQWELMEMVKNMPESSYELSLKDLVEHHRVDALDPQKTQEKNPNQNLHQRAVLGKERKKNDKNFVRRESFENKGLFLNMVFPMVWKTKKKKGSSGNNSGKVSPKPEGVKGGGGEKDWWKKKWSGSSDSESSGMSNNSGSSGSTGSSSSGGGADRKRNGLVSGCWLCFKSRKSKSAV